jgi:hypothetical protein
MPIPVRVVNGTVSQTIDLKEIFGVSFKRSESLKQKMTQALIDKMKDRIAQGLDRFDEEMAPYSKAYKESVDYIAARKNETVNMRLTGDMLGSVDLLDSKGDKVTIGFRGSKENQKAYDHMMGTERLPVRQFFGVSDEDVDSVRSDFSDEIKILSEIKSTQLTDNNRQSFRTLNEIRDYIEGDRTQLIVRGINETEG